MKPRKLFGSSAALAVALAAGGSLISSCQGGQESTVEVLLRPPRSAAQIPAQPSARLTIPRRYFARSTVPSDAASAAGVEKLVLEIEPADLPQAPRGTALDLARAPLRIEITALDAFPEGLGDRRRNEAMNQAPGAPKRMSVPPPDHPQEVTGYIFANLGPKSMAYYFKAKEDGVFVDCSERPRCLGFQSWRGLLDVQYGYARVDLDDPRPMNAAVNQLLESFKPTAVPAPESSDQSRTEPPIFQPSTPQSH